MRPLTPAKPIIGITTDHTRDRVKHEVARGYVEAVAKAGGVPIILPFQNNAEAAADVLDLVDGLLMTGGNDPDPAAWGEAWHTSAVPVDPVREAFERRLLALAEERLLPTLGICFGMQLMNLVRGGSLIQFLPDCPRDNALDHRLCPETGWTRRHIARISADSRLARVVGSESLQVNTNHRQAVGRVGSGLLATAVAEDGVVEAIEDPAKPLWLGVQWHPERQADEPEQAALFAALVDAARETRAVAVP